jgi:hypothetical protein
MTTVVGMAVVGLDGRRRDVGDDREDHHRRQAHDLPVEAYEVWLTPISVAGPCPHVKRKWGDEGLVAAAAFQAAASSGSAGSAATDTRSARKLIPT